jgi:hypothetical protein
MLVDAHRHSFESSAEGDDAKRRFPVREYGPHAAVGASARGGDAVEALEALSEAGVDHAVVLNTFVVDGMPWPDGGAWAASPPHAAERPKLEAFNERACACAASHPGLLPFVSVHPAVMTARESAAHLAELADHRGARGVKLHTIAQRTHPADPALWPTYALCEERGLPVVAHSGPDRHGAGLAMPGAFAPVLERFRRLPLVLAHLGGAAWRDTAALAHAHPQVRFDLSEIISWTGSEHGPGDDELVRLIREVGADRVMMGSDFPWYEPLAVIELVHGLPGLSAEERARILGGNAAALLDL